MIGGKFIVLYLLMFSEFSVYTENSENERGGGELFKHNIV